MNNKRMLDLRLGNIFIILGTAFGLLVLVSSQMLSASIPGDASGPNASNPIKKQQIISMKQNLLYRMAIQKEHRGIWI
jgi:hypothetical protein